MADASSRSRCRPRVFISYRRADCAGHAGRLQDTLGTQFGRDQVFMDVDGIRPGADFAETINAALDQCDVLLALIGPAWLTQSDRRGRRRLDNADDVVRRELETALRRKVVVIPVLIGEAQMPAANDLPGPLRSITKRQALHLSDQRWRSDVHTLIEELGRLLGHQAKGDRRRPDSPKPESAASTAEQRRLDLAGQQIDAQLEYNLAALQSRGAAVGKIMNVTRRELAASDKQATARHRGMDDIRQNLASAPSGRKSLLRAYELDSAALADGAKTRGDDLSRRFDDLLNGPGALAAAPQPLPYLPSTGARGSTDSTGARNRRRKAPGR
jgi:TIR domain